MLYITAKAVYNIGHADVVKLAYTLDLGSNATSVQVQVLSSAPNKNNTNP